MVPIVSEEAKLVIWLELEYFVELKLLVAIVVVLVLVVVVVEEEEVLRALEDCAGVMVPLSFAEVSFCALFVGQGKAKDGILD
jgi:hypothetical protein